MDHAWHWAYKEQITLFYAHDAYWIKCAKRQWGSAGDSEEFRKLLSSYGLIRGKLAPYFAKTETRQKFIDACNQHFSHAKIGLPWEELQNIWTSINENLLKKLPSKAASATLKLFWFYRPESLPMFDRYTKRGLESIMKQPISPENYLRLFGEFFNKIASPEIDLVEMNMQEKYISRPRVADKYLWLIGSGNATVIMRNYKSAESMLRDHTHHDDSNHRLETNGASPRGSAAR